MKRYCNPHSLSHNTDNYIDRFMRKLMLIPANFGITSPAENFLNCVSYVFYISNGNPVLDLTQSASMFGIL